MRQNCRYRTFLWCTQTGGWKQRHTDAEPAKCSPVIRWWCSGFCSLWLIISSFRSIWKQPINSIQVLIQLLGCDTRKVSGGSGLVGVKRKKGTFQVRERPRRQFSNPLIITLCCFSHFPLNLSVISITAWKTSRGSAASCACTNTSR